MTWTDDIPTGPTPFVSRPEFTPDCRICEDYAGCRGRCPGGDNLTPCDAFRPATDQHGDVDPITGEWTGGQHPQTEPGPSPSFGPDPTPSAERPDGADAAGIPPVPAGATPGEPPGGAVPPPHRAPAARRYLPWTGGGQR